MPDQRDDEPNRDRDSSYGRNDGWRSREAYENAVARAADRAVRDALNRVGIETGGADARDMTADLGYLRRIRVRSENDQEWGADKEWVRRTRKRWEKDGENLRKGSWDIVVKVLGAAGTMIAGWLVGHFGIGGK